VNTRKELVIEVRKLIRRISGRYVKTKRVITSSRKIPKPILQYNIRWVSKLFYDFIEGCDGVAFRGDNRLPSFIVANPENFKTFVGAFLDGDGSITFTKFEGHVKPVVSFYLTSANEATMLSAMLRGYYDFNIRVYDSARCYRAALFGIEPCKTFLRDILPYIRHKEKRKRALSVLSMKIKHKVTNWDLKTYEQALQLARENVSPKDVSKTLKVPLRTVKDWLNGRRPRSYYYNKATPSYSVSPSIVETLNS
jgi:hypothetical protein